jgi:hypothetical protein
MSSRVWRSFAPPGWLIVCSVLLAVLPLIQMTSLRHKGLTTDEPFHYQYGYRVLNGSPQRTGAINSSTMPFSSLHAMTSENLAVFAQPSGISLDTSWSGQVKRGRYATIALSLLLALYVLKWSYELYGRNGALLSLSLYVFDPNLLAHGQLVTADLPAALMITMALPQARWQATGLLQRGDTRFKPIGQILVRLSVSDLFGDCTHLLSLSEGNR